MKKILEQVLADAILIFCYVLDVPGLISILSPIFKKKSFFIGMYRIYDFFANKVLGE